MRTQITSLLCTILLALITLLDHSHRRMKLFMTNVLEIVWSSCLVGWICVVVWKTSYRIVLRIDLFLGFVNSLPSRELNFHGRTEKVISTDFIQFPCFYGNAQKSKVFCFCNSHVFAQLHAQLIVVVVAVVIISFDRCDKPLANGYNGVGWWVWSHLRSM